MRLLNTQSLELQEFLGEDLPPYAILSHVWSADELSFENFTKGKRLDGYGYQKIVKLCDLARSIGDGHSALDWAWNDTICIDKRSSAELSESINSMYKWYQNATICYVFLPDVSSMPIAGDIQEQNGVSSWNNSFPEKQFLASRWFTRGFTLQELLAPSIVLFFTTEYQLIGQKSDLPLSSWPNERPKSLVQLVGQASGIDEAVLNQARTGSRRDPRTACIAQKMSWASCRQTTKPEDIAYCLLGLFDVNMPLLYGEGVTKAFLRLQREIIATSLDDSIFAWELEDRTQPWSGLLATSPKAFRNCRGLRYHKRRSSVALATHELTQRGLELSLSAQHRLVPRPRKPKELTCLAYPLSSWVYSPEGLLEGRCYLKLWIEDPRSGEHSFADNATLAWRSGMFVVNCGPEFTAYRYMSIRTAISQARNWAGTDILQFSNAEKAVYEFTNDQTTKVSTYLLRWGGNAMDKVGLRGLSSVFKLCFPLYFEAEDTPARLLKARPK